MNPMNRAVGVLLLLALAALAFGFGYTTVGSTVDEDDSVLGSAWDLSRQRLDCDDPYPLSSETDMICVARIDGWDDVLASARFASMAQANMWGERLPGSGRVFGGLRSSTLPCLRAYVLATSSMKLDQPMSRSQTLTNGAGEKVVLRSDDVHGQPPRRRIGPTLFRVYEADIPDTAGLVAYVGVRAVDGRLTSVGATTAAVVFDGMACGSGDRKRVRREAEDLLVGVQIRDAGCLDPSALVIRSWGPEVPLTRVCLPRIPDLSVNTNLSDDYVHASPGSATNTVWIGSGDPALDDSNPGARLYVSVLDEDVDDGLPRRADLLEGETEQEGTYAWSCDAECANGYYYAKVLNVSKSEKVVVSVRCNAAATTSGVCSDSLARLVQKAKVLR